jgi:hypothetical protein
VRIEILAAALAPAVLIAAHALGFSQPTQKDAERRCARLSADSRVECLRQAQKPRSCDTLAGAERALCLKEGGSVKAGAGASAARNAR